MVSQPDPRIKVKAPLTAWGLVPPKRAGSYALTLARGPLDLSLALARCFV